MADFISEVVYRILKSLPLLTLLLSSEVRTGTAKSFGPRMWRKSLDLVPHRYFSSAHEIPSLYSFLQSSIFAVKRTPLSSSDSINLSKDSSPQTLTPERITALETTLQKSLVTNETDEAWKSFKILTSSSAFPSKFLTNSLITYLSSIGDTHNLKRAYASVVYAVEKKPECIEFKTIETLLNSMKSAKTVAPAISLIKCMFKNRYFVPFSVWGKVLVEICKENGSFIAFIRVFEENCRIALEEKLDHMKPDLAGCNAALEGSCRELQSVTDAENIVEKMAIFGVRPDESSFGALAYLYASKGLEKKIVELEDLMNRLNLSSRRLFKSDLIGGYLKSGNLDSVSETILCSLREGCEENSHFGEETYCEIVKGFLQNGNIKDLAGLVIKTQKLEPSTMVDNKSIGYGIVNACVSLGVTDKAHCILDEINARGSPLTLGVYLPILNAYCKDRQTAEAAQLVMDIRISGLELDAASYDSLIEASMSNQDFQSAFSLFRDMRETRQPDLKGSYLTIMTGFMENQRPELMAAFLDEVVEDPRVEVGTHDWNSIIHAFCKAGRLEDARRTFRRMVFLQYEPNDQTYLSLINGYVTGEKYFSVLILWNEVKRKISRESDKGIRFDQTLVDAFLFGLVKGGFFDAVMQVIEKSQEMKIFVDKWKYKQAYMETHKKLKMGKMRKRSSRKMEALISFKNWAGLNS